MIIDERTIVAISSPPGGARRGILRLSGPAARNLVEQTVSPEKGVAPQALGPTRSVAQARFHDGEGSQPVLLFWMPGPHSYTREDVAELHLLGSEPLLRRALAHLLELGARAALPGEFTRRAFVHGRIDLTRAEGVLELVRATNESERRSAAQLLDGGLGRRVAHLRAALDDVRALFEATLDFDETDTGHVPVAELTERLGSIRGELEEALSWEVARQPPEVLPRVLLFGAPNAGKSSLFNALLRGRRVPGETHGPDAIVSHLAGTTRDYLGGVWRPVAEGTAEVLLLDTPGLLAGTGGADATAQRLGARERAGADLILWVVAAAVERGIEEVLEEARALPGGTPVVGVWGQVDRAGARGAVAAELRGLAREWVQVSAPQGKGLEELGACVGRGLGSMAEPGAGSGVLIGLFARHRRALEDAFVAVGEARGELEDGLGLDLIAETLRRASGCLDDIEGRTTSEDLLDRIFAQFCLGK